MTLPIEAWPEILRRQDALLRFDAPISNRDAITLGMYAVEEAERFGVRLAFRVVVRDAAAFSCLMDGTGLFHEHWIDKKMNTCRATGIANLRLYAEVETGMRPRPEFLDCETNYAMDGGCVPLKGKDGAVFGYMTASGAPHEYDHESVVRAIARFLKTQAPSVVE